MTIPSLLLMEGRENNFLLLLASLANFVCKNALAATHAKSLDVGSSLNVVLNMKEKDSYELMIKFKEDILSCLD